MKRLNKGFTLMELLIVIGVLGILAAGLLAAIDPFEQLKKARDTNNRSAATELLQASQRYYANHGYLPWFKEIGGVAVCSDTDWASVKDDEAGYPHSAVMLAATGSADIVQGVVDCIGSTLGPDGEIKNTFFQGLKTTLYIQSGSTSRAAICFSPEAKSNRTDEATKYVYNETDKTVTVPVGGCTADEISDNRCLQCFE